MIIAKLIRSARMFPSEEDVNWLLKNADPNRQGTFNMGKFVEIGL
jgi:Ca2+-binding EF-hand superfamily protein